jgi:hypothetical protein
MSPVAQKSTAKQTKHQTHQSVTILALSTRSTYQLNARPNKPNKPVSLNPHSHRHSRSFHLLPMSPVAQKSTAKQTKQPVSHNPHSRHSRSLHLRPTSPQKSTARQPKQPSQSKSSLPPLSLVPLTTYIAPEKHSQTTQTTQSATIPSPTTTLARPLTNYIAPDKRSQTTQQTQSVTHTHSRLFHLHSASPQKSTPAKQPKQPSQTQSSLPPPLSLVPLTPYIAPKSTAKQPKQPSQSQSSLTPLARSTYVLHRPRKAHPNKPDLQQLGISAWRHDTYNLNL